ncbi:flavoprotein [Actinopolyspora mortivallis]|uniref:Flavoprotein n=1 Tax=Actinopolyspora mortivallis TaxID=33906 RepID=A0A2T0GSF9_ACTMO|nr:flavoprotein [Actinopolyspora mortivallis]PRW62039.1 flavoprotein [Actinopolyspora mortivallis]
MRGEAQETSEVPDFGVRRLLLVTTGSSWATGTPMWVYWMRSSYPDLRITMLLTRSARRFVTPQALRSRVNGEVLWDEWPEDEGTARHVELAEWAEAIVVYPATLHFVGRLASGLADSPALLAAQCANVPVAVAPALPPGGMDSPAFRDHWETLVRRENTVLVPPVSGPSLTTGRNDAWVPPTLFEVLEMVEQRRVELAAAEATECSPPDPAPLLADRTSL